MLQQTVVDELLDNLHAFGVKHIFGIPGDAINDLVEGTRKHKHIDFIQVRHEESGALAASAQAKLSGKLSVCVGTAGGGAIHLLNGLYDAKLDNAPVLAITGQVSTEKIGFESHQEIDSKSLFEKVAVFNESLVSPSQMPTLIRQACQHAVFQKGVSHLALPEDIASKKVSASPRSRQNMVDIARGEPSQTLPSNALIEAAVQHLNFARNPLILAGVGALNAKEPLLDLADKINAPIILSLRAKSLLPHDHPLLLGGLGMLGTKASQHAINQCDLLILAGTDFPYTSFYPDENTRIIQIDIDPTHFGRRCEVDTALHGNLGPTLEILNKKTSHASDDHFLKIAHQMAEQERSKQQSIQKTSANDMLNPQWVASMIAASAEKDAIFVCDTGAVTAWAARHLNLNGQQPFTLSANLATMGYGLSGAIGIQLAFEDRQVIALCGDGGFSMLMQDFLTAVKYQLPLNIIVFNNHKLALIKMEQEARGNPEYECDLHNPDFAEYAKLCGGQGWTVKSEAEVKEKLELALSSNSPCIVDIAIDPDKLVMPPELELGNVVNYSIARIKEVFT